MNAPAIRVQRLTRQFTASSFFRRATKVTALDDVSLDVEPGEILGLLGPNGAGKTTLLEVIATLLLPTSGVVTVGDADVVRDAARVRSQIAYCPAGASAFFPRLTGRQNLQFFLALADVPAPSTASRVAMAAELVGLAADLDRDVRGYSDGMRQRLALARAVACDANIWLLDEPTRSLDPTAQRLLRASIREIASERRVTTLVATHDLGEADALCDRVAIVRRGRLVAYGRPSELARVHGSLAAAYALAAEDQS